MLYLFSPEDRYLYAITAGRMRMDARMSLMAVIGLVAVVALLGIGVTRPGGLPEANLMGAAQASISNDRLAADTTGSDTGAVLVADAAKGCGDGICEKAEVDTCPKDCTVVRPRGTLDATPNPCTIAQGRSYCESTLTWTSTDTTYVQIWRTDAPNEYSTVPFRILCAKPQGSLVRDVNATANEKTFTLYPASGCGPNTADLSTPLDSVTIRSRSATAPPAATTMRSAWFNPQNPQGSLWISKYDDPAVAAAARGEFAALRHAGLSHVTIFAVMSKDLAWPVAMDEEIDRLARVIDDANANGLKVILLLSNPCSVPNSVVDNDPQRPFTHVGGHRAGEVINGWTLYWDIASCSNDSTAQSRAWHERIVTRLDQRVTDPDGIALIELGGHPGIPFGTELSIFSDRYRYLGYSQRYVRAIVPRLQAITSIPVGVNLLPPASYDATDHSTAYLDNFLAAVPITRVDYIDFTFSPAVRIEPILERVPPQKVIISDFKTIDYSKQLGHLGVLEHHLDLVEEHDLAGWWYWTYKDNSGTGPGLRQRGHTGANDNGWNAGVLQLLRSTQQEDLAAEKS